MAQPLYGQLADLWGRRYLMIASVGIFAGSSAICGASRTTGMLIVGRGIQGIGSGGINVLVDVIICDLVPLRERGSKVGLLFAILTVASSLGPLIGGALASNGLWRWIFYLNLPLGGVAIAVLFCFLRVSHAPSLGAKDQIRQIDWVGNGVIMTSTTLIQVALSYAGNRYAWDSPEIISILTIGLILLFLFPLLQRLPSVCANPVVPPRLFGNRTSAAALFISFNHSMLTFWVTYFFPVFFQAVLLSSPTRSGIQLLPLVFVFPAAAALVGGAISRWGQYLPVHFVGLGILTISIGCCSLLADSQPDVAWILVEIFVAVGLGMLVPALLPAVQVELTDADTATSTSAWAFLRGLGIIWGVSIPSVVFNNRFRELLWQITDPNVREVLRGAGAYEHASRSFLILLGEETRLEVIAVYVESMKRVWQIGVVFSGASFLAAFAMRSKKLRTELETEFGMEPVDKGHSSGQKAGMESVQTS